MTMAAKRFDARYDGKCNACHEDFYEGDEIGYTYGIDGVVCSDCLDGYEGAL